MPPNQGLPAIVFFEATACVVLLVLFALLHRDHRTTYFRLWLRGWIALTGASIATLFLLSFNFQPIAIGALALRVVALFAFLNAIVNFRAGENRRIVAIWPLTLASLVGLVLLERGSPVSFGAVRWETAILLCALNLASGWVLWRRAGKAHGARLLAALFFIGAVHGADRPNWPASPSFLTRVAFDDLLGVALGIAMIVLVLEGARARNEELNAKLRRLTLLTAASTQTLSATELLDTVLKHVVESVGASHGLVRLLEGEGNQAKLVIHAAVGFQDTYLKRNRSIPADESWPKTILQKDYHIVRFEEEKD